MKDESVLEIRSSIDEMKIRGGIQESRAFAAWVATTFFSVDEDDAIDAAIADGGNDQGIDAVFTDHAQGNIIFIQAHYPKNHSKSTPKAKWDALIASVPYIENEALFKKVGREDIFDLIKTLKEENPDYTLSAGLISFGRKSQQIIDSQNAYREHNSEKESNIELFYWDIEYIFEKYKSLKDADGGVLSDTIKFEGGCIEDKGQYGRAWIGSVSAQELIRLHEKHKENLFSGNIRLFLGARKGGINEQIIQTATNDPGNFWALNNGITIVAETVSEESSANSHKVIRCNRFSIVNGCQTTSSLVQAKASSDVKVLTRVIAAKTNLRSEIVRYNNSQNAVKIWAVRAIDKIQEEIRSEFRKFNIEYAPKQVGARKKKNQNVLELDKIAQYLASTDETHLIQAIVSKAELFDEPYQKIFHKNISPSQVYLAWIIGTDADQERQKLFLAVSGSQDTNSKLLSVTSSYWIILCAYKLISNSFEINTPSLTINIMKSAEFRSSLLKYIEKATDIYYNLAIDTYDPETFGSHKTALRSTSFLNKFKSKLTAKISKVDTKSLPNLKGTVETISKNLWNDKPKL